MGVIRTIKRSASILIAMLIALIIVMTPLGALADEAALGLNKRVYDDANILSADDIEALNIRAAELSEALNVHFAVLTLDDENVTDLEGYSWDFYQNAVGGVGGVYECALMTINMGTRRVAVDFYGELRTMISDEEASEIREGFTELMTDERYFEAADYFLDNASRLTEEKLAYFNIDVPEAGADDYIYDLAGALSESELEELQRDAAAVSEKTGVAHIVLIINEGAEYADEEYLKRYASSFYKRNISGKTAYGGAFIAAMSGVSGDASVSNFGSYDPENSILWEMSDDLNFDLWINSVFTACQGFLSSAGDEWQAENLSALTIDPSRKIFDEIDALTQEQEDSLRALIDEQREKTGVDFFIAFSGYSTEKTLDAYTYGLWDALDDYIYAKTGAGLTLVIGSPPETQGDVRYIRVDTHGREVYRKIDYDRAEDIENKVFLAVSSSDPYAAAQAFIYEAARYLNSPIPNVRMVDEIGWALGWSLLAAVAVAALIVLILRIMHGVGMKREYSAGNYLVGSTFRLHYGRDIFLHTHTSRTSRSKDSGSGSGSSGGGHSSRSEGSF